MVGMDRRTVSFIALALSMLYGIGFAVIDGDKGHYAIIGGVVLAIAWMAVGLVGRRESERPGGELRR